MTGQGFRFRVMETAMKRLTMVAALALAGIAAPVQAAAPRLGIASFEQLPQPLPAPYDESADANAAVARARALARRTHRLLLIDLGGNWCLDCRLLAGTFELPVLRRWLDARFVTVTVDVGRFDRNLQIPAHYGIKGRLAGVPAVLVIDPRSDRLVNAGGETALADARSLSPQGLADWLAQWVK
jgi:thiol:disulfide interchange protein